MEYIQVSCRNYWHAFLYLNYGNFINNLFSNFRSYRDGTGKMLSLTEALRPLVPLTVLFTVSTIWVVYSPNEIINKDPRIIFFTFGTIFSNICVRF